MFTALRNLFRKKKPTGTPIPDTAPTPGPTEAGTPSPTAETHVDDELFAYLMLMSEEERAEYVAAAEDLASAVREAGITDSHGIPDGVRSAEDMRIQARMIRAMFGSKPTDSVNEDAASSEFDELQLPPLLNRYDRTASISVGDELVLNVSQIYENVDEILERHQLDPHVEFGLIDIFGNAETMHALLRSGLGDGVACYIASKSAAIIRREFPQEYQQFDWAFLDTFDPLRQFNVEPDAVYLGPVHITRQLMRDHFDPGMAPQGDYGMFDLSIEDQGGILLGQLMIYQAIGEGARQRRAR